MDKQQFRVAGCLLKTKHHTMMKFSTAHCLLLLTLVASSRSVSAQEYQLFNFDDGSINTVHIDTTDGHGGLWQIGTPQKTAFASAYSSPNVIVTDTVQSYPPNDTSRFWIDHLVDLGWISPQVVQVAGYYQVDADSLNDFGIIEFSYDPDSAWIDILHDTLFAPLVWWYPEVPTLTGRGNGWKFFQANLYQAAIYLFGSVQWGDTVRWRFSFFSDGVENDRDGLMFDDLEFQDWAESIPEYATNTFHSSVAPMPVEDDLNLIYETVGLDQLDLVIRDPRGSVVRQKHMLAEHRSRIDVHDLAAGLYLYSLQSSNGRDRSMGRFVKK